MSEPGDPSPLPDPAAELFHVVDDTPGEYESPVAEAGGDESAEHLDTARIQRLAKLRRATMRQRSWHLIAVTLSAIAAIELARQAIFGAHHAASFWCIGFAIAAIAFTALTLALLRGAIQLGREMSVAASVSSTPEAPIDFAPLSDGRQRAENLAAMRGPSAGSEDQPSLADDESAERT